jgi:hypothetical protein
VAIRGIVFIGAALSPLDTSDATHCPFPPAVPNASASSNSNGINKAQAPEDSSTDDPFMTTPSSSSSSMVGDSYLTESIKLEHESSIVANTIHSQCHARAEVEEFIRFDEVVPEGLLDSSFHSYAALFLTLRSLAGSPFLVEAFKRVFQAKVRTNLRFGPSKSRYQSLLSSIASIEGDALSKARRLNADLIKHRSVLLDSNSSRSFSYFDINSQVKDPNTVAELVVRKLMITNEATQRNQFSSVCGPTPIY